MYFQTKYGNTNQIGTLLDCLLQGAADTMDHFIYALKASGHSSLVTEFLRDPVMPDSHQWDESASAGKFYETTYLKSSTAMTGIRPVQTEDSTQYWRYSGFEALLRVLRL